MRWSQSIWSLALILPAARAGCAGAQRIDGVIHALCTDEVTGYDFEYIDFSGAFSKAMLDRGIVHEGDTLDSELYAWYDGSAEQSTSNLDGASGDSNSRFLMSWKAVSTDDIC